MNTMSTFEDMAAKMFGSTTPTSQPPAPASDNDYGVDDELAAKMYPHLSRGQSPQVQGDGHEPMTDEKKATVMFRETDPALTYRDATQAIVNSAMEDHLQDRETAGQIAREWGKVFVRHDLNATEAKELADIGASALRTPPTPELEATWAETAITQLKAEYGVEGAGQALRDARAYIASVQGAAELLDELGLGSHPKVVAMAAARGRALRLAGKLKR
ncbi:hypothetical protein [Caldimonas thermodepolymerans]|uniref:hypothetical protein n=1 Tax=Caldimonas thermodepolymerans TaxID=215580 RepID=UPI002493C6DB|nr:hypothetical protein [Caldimonas thermodepolymerans]